MENYKQFNRRQRRRLSKNDVEMMQTFIGAIMIMILAIGFFVLIFVSVKRVKGYEDSRCAGYGYQSDCKTPLK